MRKNHILLFIMMKSFNQKIHSRNILFLKDAIYIVSTSYEQFYQLFSSALLYIWANTGDICSPSSLCGTQPAPDTRTSSRQPPSEAPTPRMSPTANPQSITASSWPGELNFSCSCLNWKIVYLWEAWYSVHKYQGVENHSNQYHAHRATMHTHTYWNWRLVNAFFIMIMGG